MFGTRKQATFRAWRLAGHPQVIEYDQAVLAEILAAVEQGYRKLPHGGIEVGGVLFGQGDRHLVRILATRPIPCEHALGPSFQLSEGDHARFAEALAGWAADPELQDLVPVGWYRSRTRSRIQLDDADRAFYARYFPKRWHIALVFCHEEGKPVAAAIFARSDDGMLSSSPVKRLDNMPAPAGPPPASPGEPPPRVVNAAPPAPDAPAGPEPAPAAPAPAPSPPVPPPAVPMPLESYAAAGGKTGRKVWKWFALLAAAALAIGLWSFGWPSVPPQYWETVARRRQAVVAYFDHARSYWRSLWRTQPKQALALRALASHGGLTIQWNPADEVLRNTTGGLLEIRDRERTSRYRLDPADLWKGSVPYQRDSGDVAVRLTIYYSGGAALTAATRFLGSSKRTAETSPPAEASLAAEADRLRAELRLRTQESQALEGTLLALRRLQPSRPAPKPKPAPPPVVQPPAALVQKAPASSAPVPVLEQRPPAPPRPAAPVPASTAPVTARPASPAASSGRLIWTGLLPPGGVLTITGNRPSAGSLSGELPGAPVRVTAYPAELTGNGLVIHSGEARYSQQLVIEEPGPQNSWTRTSFRYDPGQADDVEIVETPGPSNNWLRLSLRATRRPLSVIAVRWERIQRE